MSYTIFRMIILFIYIMSIGYLCNKYSMYKNDERGQAIISKASASAMIVLNFCIVFIFLLLFFIPFDNRSFSTIIAMIVLFVNLSNVFTIIYLEHKM